MNKVFIAVLTSFLILMFGEATGADDATPKQANDPSSGEQRQVPAAPPSHSLRCLANDSPASVGAHADRRPRADAQCQYASDTLTPHAA
jgi:hypothetical protein